VCLCYLGNWPFVLLSPLLLLLDTLLRRHSGTGIVSRTNRNRLQNLKQIKLPFKFTILDRSRLTLTAKFLSGKSVFQLLSNAITDYWIYNCDVSLLQNYEYLEFQTSLLFHKNFMEKSQNFKAFPKIFQEISKTMRKQCSHMFNFQMTLEDCVFV